MIIKFVSTTVENVIKLMSSMYGGWFYDESDYVVIECVQIDGWRRKTKQKVRFIVDYRDKENKKVIAKFYDKTLNKCWTNDEIDFDKIKPIVDYTVNNYDI